MRASRCAAARQAYTFAMSGPADQDAAFIWPTVRRVDAREPWRWLRQGWRDLRASPAPGLFYGAVLTVLVAWKANFPSIGFYALILTLSLAVWIRVSVVSLPMLLDRDEMDVVSAMIVSFNVLRSNFRPMLVWGAIIVALTGLGFASLYLGLIAALPVIGHASWHAYRDTVAPAEDAG